MASMAIVLKDGQRWQSDSKESNPEDSGVTAQDEAMLLEVLGLADIGDDGYQISEVCTSIADDVGRLMKIGMLIGKSTARDRYARALASAREKFEHIYDVGHVIEKFQGSTAQPWLLERLGKAITMRRQYLKYAREHRSRMEHVDRVAEDEPLSHRLTSSVPRSQHTPSIQAQIPPYTATVLSHGTRPSLMPTSASTVMITPLIDVGSPMEDDKSGTTTASSIFDETAENALQVPQLTQFGPINYAFQCPYCPTLQKFSSQRAWR